MHIFHVFGLHFIILDYSVFSVIMQPTVKLALYDQDTPTIWTVGVHYGGPHYEHDDFTTALLCMAAERDRLMVVSFLL